MKVTNSWFEQGLEQGLERGREQGREEGFQEGRRQSTLENTLMLLERRFGRPNDDLARALDEVARLDFLTELNLAAAEVSSLDEFQQRLNKGEAASDSA